MLVKKQELDSVALFVCQLFRLPLAGRHTCDAFEGTEERYLVGEAGLEVHLGEFDVGMATHQLLGIGNAVLVDVRREGTLLDPLDAVGDVAAVGAQVVGYVPDLEFAVKVGTLFVHVLSDAQKQLVGCLFRRAFLHFRRSLAVTALPVNPSACDKYQQDDGTDQ